MRTDRTEFDMIFQEGKRREEKRRWNLCARVHNIDVMFLGCVEWGVY